MSAADDSAINGGRAGQRRILMGAEASDRVVAPLMEKYGAFAAIIAKGDNLASVRNQFVCFTDGITRTAQAPSLL
jgi:hypothetical protein